jgi:hypothetical protein
VLLQRLKPLFQRPKPLVHRHALSNKVLKNISDWLLLRSGLVCYRGMVW